MKIFGWLRRIPPPQIEQKQMSYKVSLCHRTGNVLEIENVSDKMVLFIKSNIGRDQIYEQQSIAINLRDYSMAQIINQPE